LEPATFWLVASTNCATACPFTLVEDIFYVNNNITNNNQSEIIAAQDQELQTKYHVTKILQTETDGKCRPCQKSEETAEHIISARLILAREEYIKRHDTVCPELHFNICKEMGGKLNNEHWYDHVPISGETSPEGKITILWNQQCKLKINRTS
jgi:hypothetical protein